MTLPLSRNTTYAPGIAPKSADLNDIQDEIIALAADVAGTQACRLLLPAHSAQPIHNPAVGTPLSGLGTWNSIDTDTCPLMLPIPLNRDDIITNVSVIVKEADGVGEDIDATLFAVNTATGALNTIGEPKSSGHSNSVQAFGWTGGDANFPHTVANPLHISILLPQTSAPQQAQLIGAIIDYTRKVISS